MRSLSYLLWCLLNKPKVDREVLPDDDEYNLKLEHCVFEYFLDCSRERLELLLVWVASVVAYTTCSDCLCTVWG